MLLVNTSFTVQTGTFSCGCKPISSIFFFLKLECETDKIVNIFFNDGFLKQYMGNNFKTLNKPFKLT